MLSPHRELSLIFFISFLLQCFYVFMVVYEPLYLHDILGFSWENIGIISRDGETPSMR